MGQRVGIQWGISSYYGWGVYGLNLALHWQAEGAIEAFCAMPLQLKDIAVDPLRGLALKPFLARSVQFQAELIKAANGRANAGVPLISAHGNDFRDKRSAHNVLLEGKPSIAVTFFEQPLDPEAVENAKRFPLIVTGSIWNERILRAYGIEQVRTVLQGVDPGHFHPAAKTGLLRDRFLVFSGGKAEMRKGQDIVLAAFKIFAGRHPEAMLVTAWHSPWPQFARTLDASGLAKPVVFDQDDKLDVRGWAAANGIAAERVLDLGRVPNMFMPPILHEIDVALFPNRAEGGTNLVAMECMACGLPVVLSKNTGHLDLIEDGNCYPLEEQKEAKGAWKGVGNVPGWGESQVAEVVARLEQVFTDRAEAKRRGIKAAEKLSRLTWAATARQMQEIVLELA